MTEKFDGNRFLLTAAVTRYPRDPALDRPEIADDVTRIVRLLTEDFGYVHQPLGPESPTLAQLRDGLRSFCRARERRADDIVVFYLACHGMILDPGDFVLLPSDIDPEDLVPLSITAQSLVDWLMRGTRVRRLLLMIDACYSGQGARDAAQAVVRWVHRPGATDRPGVVVVTATHPWQAAMPGVFSRAFERAVGHLASGGHAQEDLPLDAVVGVINADTAVPESQIVTCHELGLTGTPPPFLPNPRYRPLLIDVDLLEQERTRHAEQRAENLQDRFLPAIRWFAGRHAALGRATQWLDDSEEPPTLVVTGNAGSGKTAMLGLLTALADPDHRPTVGRDGLPPGLGTWEDAISEAIYAGTMTTSQVRDRIAAAAAIRADTTSDLIKGLLRGSGKAQVILIDALDEASDPSDLIKGLLNPLIKECSGRIRLIIGTRPYLLTGQLLGKPGTGPYASVNLDSEEYADPQSMRSYIRRILLSADSLDSAYRPSGLYSSARPSVLGDITHAIAAAAGTSFLVARIAGATEATASRLPDPDDASWRAALPRHAGEAMQRDLRLRLGADADKAAQLLLPLAYAQGGGMPWENVWPRLADDLSPGHNYGNEELMWLRRAAGSYAVEGVVGGRSVYRLYHQALADYLVQGRKQRDDQQTIARALIGLVQPGRGGSPAWADAHPYIRAHLATHAAGGGCLDPLLDDPDYLLAAARPQLNAALGAAGSSQARRHAFTYRRAAHFLNTRPPSEWDSYLELAARCNGAPVLADRVSGHSPHRAWSARWSSWRPAMLPLYLLQGHTAPVNAVAVGELRGRAIVVSGSADKSVRVWDLVTGAAVGRPLDGHSAPVHAVAVGEVHGRPVVVSGSADKSVRVWDLENGTAIGKRLVGESSVHAVAVADRHGRPMLVSGCADGAIQLWDLEGGAQMYRLTGHSATVHAVTTAELNGRPVVLSGSVDGDVGVWDLETGAAVGEMFTDHTASVMQIDSDDLGGRPLLITRSQDLTRLRSRSAEPDKPLVQVWNLESRSSVGRTFAGHTDMPREAKMARVRGQLMVASGSRDGRVLIWSPDSDAWGPPLVTFAPGAVATTALTELQGRPAVVMGGRDGNIQVWDLEAFPPEEQAFEGFSRGVTSMVVTQLQGRTVLVIGCRNGIIHVLDLETAGSIRQFGNQKSAVRSLALAHLHGRPAVVSGSGDGKLRVWDLETGKSIVQPFGDHVGEINAVATADLDGRLVVISGGRDRVVKVWDLEACTMIGQPFTRHLSAVHALAVDEFRGEQVVISAGAERGIRVWDLKTSAEISRSLAGHPGEVHALATARLEGRHVVVSGGTDRSVRVWDLESGAAVGQPLNSHTGWVTAMAVTERAGHQIVATGSSDHSVRLWDLKTGRAVRLHNSAHENWVRTVAITELKGRLVIVSAGDDSRIIARELATGAPVGQQLIRHTGPVHAAASTTVGGRPVLVTGGEDSTVRVWDLGTGAALTSPCRGHLGPVRTIAVTEVNGRPIAISGGDDHSVRLWDLVSGSAIGQPFTLHKRRVTAVAAGNLHGRPLVASADDFGVLTWDLETMRLVGPPFTNYSDSASVLTVISVRGRPIVLSGVGSAVLAWDPESGEIWQRFKNPQGPVTAVDFEEDSCTVVMLAHGSLTPAKLPFTAVRPLRLGRAFKLMSRPWKQAYSNNRQIRSSLARLTKPDRYIVSNGSKVVIRSISDTHSVDIGADILGLAISPPNCIIAISAQGIVVLDTMSGESWTL